jgi:hypothetical protein
MKGHIAKLFLGLAVLSAAALTQAGEAEAGKYCKGRYCRHAPYAEEPGAYRYVRTVATIGGRTVVAPVRPGRWGDQVRLPGGTWEDCEITCEYTLRRNTVDFWDFQGSGRGTVSPGYFRFDVDVDTGRVYRRGPALFGRW